MSAPDLSRLGPLPGARRLVLGGCGGLGHGGTEGEPGAFLRQFGDARAGQVLSSIPLGRIARPEDVAAAMPFLSGPASQYLTGPVISVNGGRLAP